jgi:glycosyltransferase involved in cell wall biosynthesis
MRIFVISPFQLRLRRGIERFAANLASELALLGQDLTILSRSGPLPWDRRLVASGVRRQIVRGIRYFEAVWAALFYAQALVRFRPDVVIVFFAGYGEAAGLALASLVVRPRVVFVVGYPLELVPHRFVEFHQWGLDRRLNAIVVMAHHMAPAIEQFFGRATEMIPIGVDLDAFRPEDRVSARPRRERIPHLVTVAALERRKGFAAVLDALPSVMDSVGPVRYTIVGDGPDRGWLEVQIGQMRLQDHVRLVGVVDDVRPYLVDADVFLLPSQGEGLPNAYLEALAMGLPTIVSDDPPYDDIARPEFSVRIDRTDPEAMAQTIVRLLRDPARRASMGQAARREAEEVYAWPLIAQEYVRLFTELANS